MVDQLPQTTVSLRKGGNLSRAHLCCPWAEKGMLMTIRHPSPLDVDERFEAHGRVADVNSERQDGTA